MPPSLAFIAAVRESTCGTKRTSSIPYALGQRVSFEQAEGLRLEAIKDESALHGLRQEIDQAVLAPVYETIDRVAKELPGNVGLLGFCGAPWTLATYMIAGMGTRDQLPSREFTYRHPLAIRGPLRG